MKGDRAALFVDQELRTYCESGGLHFESWQAFMAVFVEKFCPRNKVQTARIELETPSYYQGSRTVEEYVDHFRELVDRAHYQEGAHIVLKFRHGLHPHIQDQVACMVAGRPSDEVPQQWYKAAILYDENRVVSEVFTGRSSRNPRATPGTIEHRDVTITLEGRSKALRGRSGNATAAHMESL
jgi:hypothetical protein